VSQNIGTHKDVKSKKEAKRLREAFKERALDIDLFF